MNTNKKIVFRVEDDMDPKEILCTTYQMRNFYAQFRDGFFSGLDVMNFIQHYKAVTMMKKNDTVLDVCCGRGLLLPMIRYYKNNIKEYIGVDICEKNINEQKRRSGVRPIDGLDYYDFNVNHVISNVSEMSNKINKKVDFIVYTSSIEHMQKEHGYQSLVECYKLLKPGKKMFLSCPNTMDKKDPYDTQYRAHLYEWNLTELKEAVLEVGFKVNDVFGLYSKKRKFDKLMENDKTYQRLKEYFPTPFLMSFYPVLYPEYSDEVLLVLSK